MTNKKPNILVIFGDDIGLTNLSCYSHGLMGYKTPNIDKIASDGIMALSHYAEQSCTAGRSAFITGQSCLRTGLSKVGLPGAEKALSPHDPTLAQLLKSVGYNTAQFGKNHLGDSDESLPTNHGFDVFFGNLYHLNAEEEPEERDYPNPEKYPIMNKSRPRGVISSYVDSKGKQIIKDTGPLTKERMKTVDREIFKHAKSYLKKIKDDKNPFFMWFNTTGMHLWTHPDNKVIGQSGEWGSPYLDVMIEHDKLIGDLLKHVPKNTIVVYTTDNGPHKNTWPDAGTSPFRGEKNTNWEGSFRVPFLIKYPGVIPKGQVYNSLTSHLDLVPTLCSFAGLKNISKKLLKGYKGFNVHLDGYDMVSHFVKNTKCPRNEFFYISDDGECLAVRMDVWKVVFAEQRMKGTMKVWSEPFVKLRLPKIFNLRLDPFEEADVTSNTYYDWIIKHAFIYVPMQKVVTRFAKTFIDYPPRMKPSSFTIDQIIDQLKKSNPSS
ncbi:arylsulfatase [Tetraselmis virus 1]|uniref:Arylsulfatase n=1 Tax=Tetraselmis virus 1 TaxID=2060617 RepID=A0A2P0VMN7_9VIRU|nr:arylsulfatase [Tetraselmis virus 1]AUF82142.1 arylsulfatase [Tetraselmis virus 1]